MKSLAGYLTRRWVVSPQWVERSAEANRFLDGASFGTISYRLYIFNFTDSYSRKARAHKHLQGQDRRPRHLLHRQSQPFHRGEDPECEDAHRKHRKGPFIR